MASKHDVWVVIPAYNEGAAITKVLAQLAGQGYGVVIVDDGSKDDTGQQALTFPVIVLRHACNLGQGAALQTGISYVLRQPEAEYVVTFDADGQHAAAEIPRLLRPLQEGTCDVVLGSRFMQRGQAIDLAWRKRLLLQLAVAYTRLSTGLAVTDTHNGFRAFTVAAARRIAITQNRMAHASELLAQIAALGLRYCEVPVTIRYTAYSLAKGQSMLNSINILWDTMRMRVR